MNMKHRLGEHIKKNRWQYVLITLIFVLGILMGDFKVDGLEGGVRSHLLSLLDGYLNDGITQGISGESILLRAFINQGKSILLIWFLGLTVIGMPLF